jgi:hypothetical protein
MCLLVVLPYRDDPLHKRQRHLALALWRLRALHNSIIAVAEQSDDGKRFNRGAVLNAVFGACHCRFRITDVIFHDIDLLPSPALMVHYVKPLPEPCVRHLAGAFVRYNQQHFLGGITMISTALFCAVNGFPNDFYGWGGEDDELLARLGHATHIERVAEPLVDLEDMDLTDKMDTLRADNSKCPDKRERRAAHRLERARGHCHGLSDLRCTVDSISDTFNETLQQRSLHFVVHLHKPDKHRRLR